MRRIRTSLLTTLLLVGWIAGCQRETTPDAFVARVGDVYLMQEEIDAALETLSGLQDTSDARRQFIDRWVTNELLYQEALRRNLRSREAVQRRLAESERSVLVDALVSMLLEQETSAVSPAEVRAYFERHKERLRLREPFVRVRYLFTTDADSARQARRRVLRATPHPDSTWLDVATRFARDVDGSLTLSGHYYPESRLFVDQPALRTALARLRPGETTRVIATDSLYHVIQLVARAPAGTVPELAWIEDEVQRQLTIDARKQMYERQVQRLRTEALDRNALVIR